MPVERSTPAVLLFDVDSLESPRLTFNREELLSEADRDPKPLAALPRDEEEPLPEFEREPPESPREELPELALLELLEPDERLLSELLLELDERELSELLLELDERSELPLDPE